MPYPNPAASIPLRLRQAVQWCKESLGYQIIMHDSRANLEVRANMENCLTRHFLVRKGADYFGKRDLIYVDMRGDQDSALRSTWDRLGPDFKAIIKADKEAAAAAKAAAAGEEEGGEEGEEGEDEE